LAAQKDVVPFGIMTAGAVLGALYGHQIPTWDIEVRSRFSYLLDAVAHAKNVIGYGILGGIVACAVDMTVNGVPERGNWRLGICGRILAVVALAALCYGAVCFVKILSLPF
jgi:uncharacterized sodium:solute symporter family permease YidK